METFLRGDKIQKGSIGYDALSDDAKVLIGTNGDSPFEKGSVENSAVLKGGDNQVISEGGVALGENNFVGLKGWYINDIYTNDGGKNYNMTISSKNTELGDLVEDSDFNCTYEEGDIISIQIGSIFTNIGRIEIIQEIDCGHYIFFSSLKYFSLPQSDPEKRYYLWVLSKPNAGVVDLGQNAISYGLNNQSLSECAYAEGKNNKAFGKYAHVEGKENEAHYCSHAEGSNNIALGNTSHAEGTDNRALNSNTHVEGRYTYASGYASHAEGYGESVEVSTEASGEGAHAEGRVTKAQGNYSHTEGQYTSAVGIASHAEGKGESVANPNLASGNYSHVEGEKTKATNIAAHAEGIITTSSGKAAHAEGRETQALADYSHAEGYLSSVVSGAIGGHSEGVYNIVNNPAEHASGKYNISTPKTADNTTADATHFSIGIGTSTTNRKNAFEVKQNGDIYIEGVEGRIQDRLNDTSKEKVFIIPEDFFGEMYDEPDENGFVGKIKQEYVTNILENRYTKMLVIDDNSNPQVGEFDYSDEYILKCKVRIEDFSQGLIFEQIQIFEINVNRDSVDFCKVKLQGFNSYFPFVYSMFDEDPQNSDGFKRLMFIDSILTDGMNLPEENKQFFKKNMGSFADWNAQEGEAGYIENKPFGFEYCSSEDIIVENPRGDFEMEILRYSEEDGYWGYHDDLGDNPLVVLTKDGIIIAEMQLALNTSNTNGNGGDFWLKLEDNVLYIVGWSDNESETFKYYIGEPKQLNEVFIPDTIARKSDLEELSEKIDGIEGGSGSTSTESATPDWNALVGEDGYIKNKPFEFGNEDSGFWSKDITVDAHEDGSDETITILTAEVLDEEGGDIYWDGIDWVSSGDAPFVRLSGTPDGVIIAKIGDLPVKKVHKDDYPSGLYKDSDTGNIMYGAWFDGDTTIKVELASEIYPISEYYIPDTIARKSDIPDIDPVVWKYMCNPYIISAYGTPDNDLPEELRNIIEDEDGYLTTLALKVLAMNYDGVTYSINYVTGTTIKSEFGLLIYEHGRFYPEP